MEKIRGYAILAKNIHTGEICGFNEFTRSKFMHNKVKIYTPKFTEYYQINSYYTYNAIFTNCKCENDSRALWIILNNKISSLNFSHKDWIFKVFKVNSKYCPINVNWKDVIKVKRKLVKNTNIDGTFTTSFTLKENVMF